MISASLKSTCLLLTLLSIRCETPGYSSFIFKVWIVFSPFWLVPDLSSIFSFTVITTPPPRNSTYIFIPRLSGIFHDSHSLCLGPTNNLTLGSGGALTFLRTVSSQECTKVDANDMEVGQWRMSFKMCEMQWKLHVVVWAYNSSNLGGWGTGITNLSQTEQFSDLIRPRAKKKKK